MTLRIAEPLKLNPASFTPRPITNLLVVHCTGSGPQTDYGAVELNAMHRKERGWKAIGYHYVIRRNGTVERGRPHTVIGSHVQGYNSRSLGITLVGGSDRTGKKPEANFTDFQMRSLKELLTVLRKTYPGSQIVGHRDLSPDKDGDGTVEQSEWLKWCPSFDVRQWLKGAGL